MVKQSGTVGVAFILIFGSFYTEPGCAPKEENPSNRLGVKKFSNVLETILCSFVDICTVDNSI